MIILPTQARDKHKGNFKKGCVFRRDSRPIPPAKNCSGNFPDGGKTNDF